MSIVASDLKWYGSATMPDDDTVTNIGGAIDTSKKVEFNFDAQGLMQILSTAADTTQTVTIFYKDPSGTILSEVHTLNGVTPVLFTANMLLILKAVKSATTTGDIAVEQQTATRTGTAQAGFTNTITLDAGASAVDGFYNGFVIRLTGGTGSGQIRQIIAYDGTTKIATVSYNWGTQPDNTSVFRVSKGCVFEKSPFEILQCRRPFYASFADVPGGSTRTYYDKVFFINENVPLALTNAQIQELSNPSGQVAFGLPATANDSGTNGGGNNRQVAPAGITFATTPVNVPGGIVTSSTSIGVWLQLTRLAGAAALNSFVTMRGTGQTV